LSRSSRQGAGAHQRRRRRVWRCACGRPRGRRSCQVAPRGCVHAAPGACGSNRRGPPA
jgi:hypothetical protein